MSIMKNEIPILEYDTDHTAVIMPDHEKLGLHLPAKAVFAFLREHIDNYAKKNNCIQVGTFVSATKLYPIYVAKHNETDICLCQAPVGSAAAAQLMDWLIGYGVTSEALYAVMTFLFNEVGMHRVFVKHDVENPASGKVMQKCNMIYEGRLREHYLRHDGTYSDALVYSILKNEYLKNTCNNIKNEI